MGRYSSGGTRIWHYLKLENWAPNGSMCSVGKTKALTQCTSEPCLHFSAVCFNQFLFFYYLIFFDQFVLVPLFICLFYYKISFGIYKIFCCYIFLVENRASFFPGLIINFSSVLSVVIGTSFFLTWRIKKGITYWEAVHGTQFLVSL